MKKTIPAFAAAIAAGAFLVQGAGADVPAPQNSSADFFIAAESKKITELRPRFMRVVDKDGAPVMIHAKDQDGKALYAVKSSDGPGRVIAPEMRPATAPATANTESRFMEVVESHSVVPRFASACVKGRDGQDYTVRMQFILGVHAGDIGVDMNKRNERGEHLVYGDFSPVLKRLDDYAAEVAEKFPAEMLERALPHVSDAWQESVKGFTKEDIGYVTAMGSEALNKQVMAPAFMTKIQNTLTRLTKGERASEDKPSFTEETGIRIMAGAATPGGILPGCNKP